MLKLIGCWSGGPELVKGPSGYKLMECSDRWIHPSILIDEDYMPEIRPSLVNYLRKGLRINHDLGYSFCRFSDGPSDQEMGSCEQTDGVWAWPEGLWIYVEKYMIRLPEEFIYHAEGNNFSVPELEPQSINTSEYDVEFWDRWCEKERLRAEVKSQP
jgi:hypothetical protein